MAFVNIDFIHFIVVAVLGFLVGMEVRSYRHQSGKPLENKHFFGDVRTFTFVAILGFVLFALNRYSPFSYVAGFVSLVLLFALLYQRSLSEGKRSILLFVVLLLVYSLGALIQSKPLWMSALVYVSIVFVLNFNQNIEKFSTKINVAEFEILGKMVLLSAVILPLLPDRNIVSYIPLSPFKIWLVVVVISGISYAGYVLQKYFFPSKGYFLTGIIGGSYSSTATTVVLARKAKTLHGFKVIDAAIIASTAVMYLRLVIIAFLFNVEIAKLLVLPFLAMAAGGFVVASVFLKSKNTKGRPDIVDHNPLELKTAFIFAFLFVAMMVVTKYVTDTYGSLGLEILSFIVGFTDIDPFILSVLTGKFSVTPTQIVAAVMIAAGSNNLLKAIYALWFGGVKNTYTSAMTITLLGILTIGWGVYLEFNLFA